MRERFRLFCDCLDPARVAVPYAVHGDSRAEVEVLVSVFVVKFATLALGDGEVAVAESGHCVFVGFFFCRHG